VAGIARCNLKNIARGDAQAAAGCERDELAAQMPQQAGASTGWAVQQEEKL